MKRVILCVMGCFVFLFACKKSDTDSNNTSTPKLDELSDTQIQALEAAGVDTVSTFTNARFSDGTSMKSWAQINDPGYVFTFSKLMSPSDKRKLFIERLTQAGSILVNKSLYNFSNQHGIAYVYNSKEFLTPSVYPGNVCQTPMNGLECSGMIYQMAKASNLHIGPMGTSEYINVQAWNSAFSTSPDFKGLEMRDTGRLDPSLLEAGDIIIAPNVHMGVIFDNGISKGIYNSLGRSSYSCERNSDINHGPVITRNVTSWLRSIFNNNYSVLRVIQNGKSDCVNKDTLDKLTGTIGGPLGIRGIEWKVVSHTHATNGTIWFNCSSINYTQGYAGFTFEYDSSKASQPLSISYHISGYLDQSCTWVNLGAPSAKSSICITNGVMSDGNQISSLSANSLTITINIPPDVSTYTCIPYRTYKN